MRKWKGWIITFLIGALLTSLFDTLKNTIRVYRLPDNQRSFIDLFFDLAFRKVNFWK